MTWDHAIKELKERISAYDRIIAMHKKMLKNEFLEDAEREKILQQIEEFRATKNELKILLNRVEKINRDKWRRGI